MFSCRQFSVREAKQFLESGEAFTSGEFSEDEADVLWEAALASLGEDTAAV